MNEQPKQYTSALDIHRWPTGCHNVAETNINSHQRSQIETKLITIQMSIPI